MPKPTTSGIRLGVRSPLNGAGNVKTGKGAIPGINGNMIPGSAPGAAPVQSPTWPANPNLGYSKYQSKPDNKRRVT